MTSRVAARRLLLHLVSVFSLSEVVTYAQDATPQLVEVPWRHSASVSLPGVTQVIVLDESIVRAEVSPKQIELVGLRRGETIVFAWRNEQRTSFRVSVVWQPAPLRLSAMSRQRLATGNFGRFGASVHAVTGAAGSSEFVSLEQLEWHQSPSGAGLVVRAQTQHSTIPGANPFNVNTVSIAHESPRLKLSFLDFSLDVNGNTRDLIQSPIDYTAYPLRGFNMLLRRGQNEFEWFGGVTIPPYFRTLNGTRDVAGFTYRAHPRNGLVAQSTAGWVNVPGTASGPQPRQSSMFGTAGLQFAPNPRWRVRAMGGASTRGGLVQGATSYTGDHLSVVFTGNHIAPDFPLSQLQLRLWDGASWSTAVTQRFGTRLSGSMYFEHHSAPPRPLLPAQSSSEYLSSNISLAVVRTESVAVNYVRSRSASGLALLGQSDADRYDVALNSRFGPVSNTAQVLVGTQAAPVRFESQREITWRETLNVPIPSGSVNIAVQRTRRDPSLVSRLKADLDILTPALQQLFLSDPVQFYQTSLPPDLRALVEHLDLTETQANLSGQIRVGKRLNVSPSVGYWTNVQGLNGSVRSRVFGYAASWQVTSQWQLASSLSHALVFDPRAQRVQRSRVLNIAFNKTFSGAPRRIAPFGSHHQTVRGRVFRDLNSNGRFDFGEPGLGDVRVEYDGQAVVTDHEGQFEIPSLAVGIHRVRLPLTQFSEHVRVTGPSDVEIDVTNRKAGTIEFGVVNFARLIGVAFNDDRLDGRSRPDAKGVRGIGLILASDGVNRRVATDGAGEYSLSDVTPGDYQLAIDSATLPPGFVGPNEPISLHLEATTTTVRDIPLRAVRSIAGHVYYAPSGTGVSGGLPAPGPHPLEGVRLTAGGSVAITDGEGSFLLRDLPAGDIELAVVPAQELPATLHAPTGKITLPPDPIHVDNVRIVISNPELLGYIRARPLR